MVRGELIQKWGVMSLSVIELTPDCYSRGYLVPERSRDVETHWT